MACQLLQTKSRRHSTTTRPSWSRVSVQKPRRSDWHSFVAVVEPFVFVVEALLSLNLSSLSWKRFLASSILAGPILTMGFSAGESRFLAELG